MPEVEHPPDLAWRWIVANAFAMLVTALFSFGAFLTRMWLGADSAEGTIGAKVTYAVIAVILMAISAVIYARLTGSVLRQIVPALRGWTRLHLALGIVVGLAVGLLVFEPDSAELIDWGDVALVAFLIAVAAAGGALLGAVVGGLQALVLRKTARGVGRWIGYSALSVCIMCLIALPVVLMLSDRLLANEIIIEIVLAAAGVVGAFVMLPAVRRLRRHG